ncbi:glycerate kinase [uncultured Ilyobacter sp.]|uniref:glycerate kinase family protein n=1 Tax=uncultured Ilyobacter sp. TaxID=544433 RepID=UPI002AA5E817|nr:glycerate kinase [uncultured Ilyobacter sp.]
MKVVVAIDSFKGSVSSFELGNFIENGIKNIYPNAEVKKIPIADGGEGTVESLVEGTGGEFIDVSVNGPLMKPVLARYGIMGDNKTAVIEMASASGLPLITKEMRNPRKTTTYGTGELIKDAIKRGCREFLVGIGGSATNDAGIGMLQALGYKFLDKEGEILGFGGEILEKIVEVDTSEVMTELKECRFLVACDVDNPLYGPNGASHVYSRQKGADEETVYFLDSCLEKFASFTKDKLQKDIGDLPGAGAAGGLGGGFVAFLNAELKPGIEIVLEKVKFEDAVKGADFVITGEGKIDFQSIMGKAPVGVSKVCKRMGIPVIALAGGVADDAGATHDHGIEALFSVVNYPISLKEAMDPERARIFVENSTEEIFRLINVCEKKFK